MQIYPTKGLPLPGQKPRKRNRTALTIALAVALVALVGGVWWFGVGLPANQAADARAAEQAKTEAAEKKKEEDSAAFWAQVAMDNKAKSEKATADAAAFNASQATRQSDSVKRQM
jgi:cytoskeletal protein RodZ